MIKLFNCHRSTQQNQSLFGAVVVAVALLCANSDLLFAQDSAKKPANNNGTGLSDKTKWSVQMRSLESSLAQILFLTTNNESLDSKETKTGVLKEAASLKQLAAELANMSTTVDPDPSVKIISEIFLEETKHAEESFRLGHRDYARRIFRSLPVYCVACHSRDASGPHFSLQDNDSRAEKLQGLVKADYFAATRRFEEALKSYESVIKDTAFLKNHPLSWQRAVQSAVTISVRADQSPSEALRFLELAQNQTETPLYFKEQVARWIKAVKNWKKEPQAKPGTEAGLFAKANKLFQDAMATQSYPADRSGDIQYLRSTALLHEYLRKFPNGKNAADALYLAGLSYEVLKDPALGSLHEYFYLTCISKYPNTNNSQKCFERYEESVHIGYSGSGGENLPDEIADRLKELKRIATPNTSGTGMKVKKSLR